MRTSREHFIMKNKEKKTGSEGESGESEVGREGFVSFSAELA